MQLVAPKAVVAAGEPHWSHNTVDSQIFLLKIKRIGTGEVEWGRGEREINLAAKGPEYFCSLSYRLKPHYLTESTA